MKRCRAGASGRKARMQAESKGTAAPPRGRQQPPKHPTATALAAKYDLDPEPRPESRRLGFTCASPDHQGIPAEPRAVHPAPTPNFPGTSTPTFRTQHPKAQPAGPKTRVLVAHRQGWVALVLHGDQQAVGALPLAVGRRGPRGDLAGDAVHAEGEVLVPAGDVVGQDAVEAGIPVGGTHLDHRRAPADVLQGG